MNEGIEKGMEMNLKSWMLMKRNEGKIGYWLKSHG